MQFCTISLGSQYCLLLLLLSVCRVVGMKCVSVPVSGGRVQPHVGLQLVAGGESGVAAGTHERAGVGVGHQMLEKREDFF